ncbi:PilZ domain-containing protein [Thiomicrorhabdus sp.]|uniref:PilZ domain-containing protein n=1 Tax=Thiomicrorhabdus sp. TaxID=2039724 RepID=UPI00356262E3
MPGTHYDSDHSFLEALPFEYKKIAYKILRSSSLEIMLMDLRSQYSKHFEEFKVTEPLEVDYIEKTICACIVAKITSFSKGLYINEIHFQFLLEVLYKALGVLVERPGAENKVIDAILVDSHPKTLHWINKDKSDHGKHSLAIRSRRENTRRYFRYQANMSYHFIRIGNHEKVEELHGDIYSSGVKHFNKIVNEKLDTIVVNYSKNIQASLQDNYPEAHDLFMVVLEKLEYLREVLNGISNGVLDIKTAMRFLTENINNELDYASLNGNIRTESILRDFEEKLNQINRHTITLLENSTPHKLYEGPVLQKLKIDHDIRGYVEKNKKNGSKLLKAFIDLYHYTLLMEKVYNNISSSNYIIIFPEYWSQEYQDISPGGFAFLTEFLVEKNDILELFFRIDVSTSNGVEDFEIIHQRAKVVRIEPRADLGRYLIACEFMTCPEETVMLISHAIQGQEVKDAYNSSGLLDEDDAFGI